MVFEYLAWDLQLFLFGFLPGLYPVRHVIKQVSGYPRYPRSHIIDRELIEVVGLEKRERRRRECGTVREKWRCDVGLERE